jgi:hypothetical protein
MAKLAPPLSQNGNLTVNYYQIFQIRRFVVVSIVIAYRLQMKACKLPCKQVTYMSCVHGKLSPPLSQNGNLMVNYYQIFQIQRFVVVLSIVIAYHLKMKACKLHCN